MKLEITCEVVFRHRVKVVREVPDGFDLTVFQRYHDNWLGHVRDDAMLVAMKDKWGGDPLVDIVDLEHTP